MSIRLNDKFIRRYVSAEEMEGIRPQVETAFETLRRGDGLGSDFLGWIRRPVDYDKEEYARIQAAAEKIRKSCDVLIVIGIGGSYLGARAAIEFVRGNYYNSLHGDAPEIYFAGNSISASALADTLRLCEGRTRCCLPYFPGAFGKEIWRERR